MLIIAMPFKIRIADNTNPTLFPNINSVVHKLGGFQHTKIIFPIQEHI